MPEHTVYLLYRIYHNLTAMFQRPYEHGDVLVCGHSGDVERYDTPEQTCDAVFAIHNRDDRPDGKTAPSLSVGDVVSLRVGVGWLSYSVAMEGWVRCSPSEGMDVIDGPYAEVAAKFRLAAETALMAAGHGSISKPLPCTCDSCAPPPGGGDYTWVSGSDRAKGHWRRLPDGVSNLI